MDRRFKLIEKDSDYFTSYLNAITRSFDPTTYLPPEEKDFDINMTGKLEGIGAVLRETDGFIKVIQIIPGAHRGARSSRDTILKVSQQNGDAIVSLKHLFETL